MKMKEESLFTPLTFQEFYISFCKSVRTMDLLTMKQCMQENFYCGQINGLAFDFFYYMPYMSGLATQLKARLVPEPEGTRIFWHYAKHPAALALGWSWIGGWIPLILVVSILSGKSLLLLLLIPVPMVLFLLLYKSKYSKQLLAGKLYEIAHVTLSEPVER